jgi:hypothetical protein
MAFVRGGEVGEVLFEMVHGSFEAKFGGTVFYLNSGVVIEGFGVGGFDVRLRRKIDEFVEYFFRVGEIFKQGGDGEAAAF